MSAYFSSSIRNKVSHIYYGTENMPLKRGTIAQPSRHCMIYPKREMNGCLSSTNGADGGCTITFRHTV